MVLRSGIIIPFQFRDSKKLLMIGVPEENRNLNIWDLRNVVRAAFGIYNFEFRNKKIGFNIPDELLLHYLAQRHDLTNFVIEIGQANPNDMAEDNSLIDSSSSENFMTPGSNMLLNENFHIPHANRHEFSKQDMTISEDQSELPTTSGSLDKECAYQEYPVCSETRPKTQSITDENVIPKSEQSECESERKIRLEFDDIQVQPNQESQQLCHRQPFEFRDDTSHLKKVNYQQHPFTSCAINRFRRRGERMSKDQKEVYVKYFEENPVMLSQRRNDAVLESHWIKLAAILNNVPQGAVKNVEEWKQTFDAWRYRVFMYYRYNYKLAGSVTHNEKNFKPLTSTDQRAYSMWTSYKNTASLQSDKADTFCKSEDILYDPCKENFTTIGSCTTCHCPAAQKASLDIHENASTPIYHPPVGARSNTSGTSSQNSQNADELPAIKIRMQQHGNIAACEISHMEIEPKIDYDSAINTTGANTDVEDSSPPPMTVHAKTSLYADEEQQQQQQHQQELHLERLQHEYALQQHQQQQHFEALMQENTTGNSFRQRKERMSKKQKEIYVNFMEQNPVINEHRRSDPILDQYWVKLADVLNSVPQGAVKHVAEWKQTFDNWRYRVFLYARYNSKITGADALNPKSFKPLTQTDKRAYHFWIRNPDTAPPDLEKMRNVFVNLEETQQE